MLYEVITSCTNLDGVVRCDLGDLMVTSNALVTLVVRPLAGGSVTNRVSVGAAQPDLNPANNASEERSTVIIDTGVFFNTQSFNIPDVGPAALYPSTIFVSGVTVRVDSVSVTSYNFV